MGLACWRQLSIRPNIATGGTPRTKRLISMGLEGGLGIGLLASTFDPAQQWHVVDPKDKKVNSSKLGGVF